MTLRRLPLSDAIALLIIATCVFFAIRYSVSSWIEVTRLSQQHENDKVIIERIGRYGGRYDSFMYSPTGGTRFVCKLRNILPQFESVISIHFDEPGNSTPLRLAFLDQELADALKNSRGIYRVVFKNQVLSDEDVSLLAKLRNVETLSLIDCGLSDKDTEFLENLPDLESLHLTNMPVASRTVRHLRACPQLTELDLSATEVADSDLSELGHFPQLKTLNLYETRITGKSMASLAKFPNLVKLNIGGTAVDDVSLASLKEARKLQEVKAWGTRISPQAAKAFQRETGIPIEL